MSDYQMKTIVLAVGVNTQMLMLFLWIMFSDFSSPDGWKHIMAMGIMPVSVGFNLLIAKNTKRP